MKEQVRTLADMEELVIQIRATTEGFEATIEDVSRLVRKFAQEAEAATSKPFSVEVQTDSLREAVSGMIGLGEKTAVASTAGTLLKATLLDIGSSIASSGLTLLINIVIQGILGIINAAKEAEKKQEEARQEAIKNNLEMARQHSDTAKSIRTLGDEYAKLGTKIRTESEERTFLTLQADLAEALGITQEALKSQIQTLDDYYKKLAEAERAEAGKAAGEYREAAKLKQESMEYKDAVKGLLTHFFATDDRVFLPSNIVPEKGEAALKAIRGVLSDLGNGAVEEARSQGNIIKQDLADIFVQSLIDGFTLDNLPNGGGLGIREAGLTQWFTQLYNDLGENATAILSDPKLYEGLDFLNNLDRALAQGLSNEQITAKKNEHLTYLRDSLPAAYEALGNGTREAGQSVDELLLRIVNQNTLLEGGDWEGYLQHIRFSARDTLILAKAIGHGQAAMDLGASGLNAYQRDLKDFDDQLLAQEGQKHALELTKQLAEQYKEGIGAGEDVSYIATLLQTTAGVAGVALTSVNGQLVDLDGSIQAADQTLQESMAGTRKNLEEVLTLLEAEKVAFMKQEGLSGDVGMNPTVASYDAGIEVLEYYLSLMDQLSYQAEGELPRSLGEINTSMEGTWTAAQLAALGAGEMQKQLDGLEGSITRSKSLKAMAADTKEMVKSFEQAKKEGKDTSGMLANINKNGRALGIGLKMTGDNVKDFGEALEQTEASADSALSEVQSQLNSVVLSALEVENALWIDGKITADEAEAHAALMRILQNAEKVQEALDALGALGDGGGRRSGGSRRKSKAELAEEARRAAEEARQEAIRQDYALLDHKRHLNQLTLEQELATLHQIRAAHELNAKEIMEWEQKVYDVKREIRRRDASSIDKAGDALIDALSARYQAMQDAEIGRLDASRKAWEDWRDDSVKAIRDQIAALDELSKTQDREKQDQEELRKIAKLRQDIEFEQDEYNRMKLQQQLDQAISGREDRLRRLAVQDQKEALQKQIEVIQDQAEAQLTALDSEQEEIEKAYAERMKTAALRAEAEKLLMTGTQREIIDLIGEFAPEYDALGKTLGEKLLAGFQSKVGNVVHWFKQLNESLYQIQEQAAAQAVAAANQFQSGYQERQGGGAANNAPPPTVVNQTVNFNEPVESAGQTARRIQQANQELGALLYGG